MKTNSIIAAIICAVGAIAVTPAFAQFEGIGKAHAAPVAAANPAATAAPASPAAVPVVPVVPVAKPAVATAPKLEKKAAERKPEAAPISAAKPTSAPIVVSQNTIDYLNALESVFKEATK